AFRQHILPAGPEAEALVATLIYVEWRIGRYQLDEAMIQIADAPGQPQALETARSMITSLEQVREWTYASLLVLGRAHELDASESAGSGAATPNLASFHKVAAARLRRALAPTSKLGSFRQTRNP